MLALGYGTGLRRTHLLLYHESQQLLKRADFIREMLFIHALES
jgi:hypothetical protein